MNEDISRQSHDSALKWAAQMFRDEALGFLGLRVPRIDAVASTDLPEVTVRGHVMDFLFLLEDGTSLHLEFQSVPAVLRDFLLYDALLYRRDGRPVRTVVVYTGAVEAAPEVLDIGSAVYRVANVYLRTMDGETARAELRRKVQAGAALSRADAVRAMFLPLMRHSAGRLDGVAAEALGLLQGVADPDLRAGCQAAMLGLCKKLLSPQEWRRLEVVAVKFPIVEEAIARGLVQGRVEGKMEAVLVLLKTRFGTVPDAVSERVRRERDPEALDRWIAAAATVGSLDEFRLQMAVD